MTHTDSVEIGDVSMKKRQPGGQGELAPDAQTVYVTVQFHAQHALIICCHDNDNFSSQKVAKKLLSSPLFANETTSQAYLLGGEIISYSHSLWGLRP
ncbi:TPA: hypothetical protein EYP66_22890 [Candidatus Poribacteria bacterium]|nr:hypothetical protein [Candidatus Poribacteria bacterium]